MATIDHNAELAKQFQIERLPTDVVLSPSGQVLGKFNSPKNATAYVSQLGQVAASSMQKLNGQIDSLLAPGQQQN